MPLRKLIDLTGHVFGRLTVLRKVPRERGQARWECRCECGKYRTILSQSLRGGLTRSCGCWRRQLLAKIKRTHGMSFSSEWGIWQHMKGRCFNPKDHKYTDYGGRGISMCDEWRNDFTAFLAYVGPRPSPKHSIDRFPNNDGHYEPGNVRWATAKEQVRNRRPRRDSHQ